MKLFCAVVGETGSAFEVDIDAKASVSALKEAIKEKKRNDLEGLDADKLQLFLAKKGKAWLSDDKTGDVVLQSGDIISFKEMRGSWKLNDSELFGSGVLPTEKVLHVLVVVPEDPPRKKQRVGDIELMHFTTNEQAELDAICKLGQGLTREALVTGKLVKIPQKVLRVDLSGGLYVRQEYWDVHAIMNKKGLRPGERVLVIGSPGIGKSVFGVFLLLLFMTERKNVAYRPLDTVEKKFFFTWNAAENRYDGTLWPVSTNLYEGLFDGREHRDWADATVFVHSYLFAQKPSTNL